jgi:hypothetical protein
MIDMILPAAGKKNNPVIYPVDPVNPVKDIFLFGQKETRGRRACFTHRARRR